MLLHQLIQAYEFDEIMPIIAEMFPGTGKFHDQLEQAYNTLRDMEPAPGRQAPIHYQLIPMKGGDETYVGAKDQDFKASWEVLLGKDVTRARGVDLNDAELVANCLVNVCLLGRHPHSFDKAYEQLRRG